MKNKLKLLCCCVCILSVWSNISYAQYTIDWQNAPMNPLPGEEFTLNHFRLAGDVITRKHDEVTETFQNGKLSSISGLFGNSTYTYDQYGHLKRMEVKDVFDITVDFICDKQGRVLQLTYKSDKTGKHFSYNSKGLFAVEKAGLEKKPNYTYRYDDKNRITEIIHGNSETTFTYKKDQKGLKVVQRSEDKSTNKVQYDTSIFNQYGHQISRNGKAIKLTYDNRGNILSYQDSDRGVFIKYSYTYGSSATVPTKTISTAKPIAGGNEINNLSEILALDNHIFNSILPALKTIEAAHGEAKKLLSTGLVPWQKREVIKKTEKLMKEVSTLLQTNLSLLEKREQMAKAKGFASAITSSAQARQKFIEATYKNNYLLELLDPIHPFESNDIKEWTRLSIDLSGRMGEETGDILAAFKILSPQKESTTLAPAVKESANDMKVSEMIPLLNDLEVHRLAFVNLGVVEMRESIEKDFYIAALNANGNQPLLQHLLTNERKRQLQLAVKVSGLIKQADSAIAICIKIKKNNTVVGYEKLKKELISLYKLSMENGREIESNGDLSKKDAAALMAIVQKTHPDMTKAHDIVFGIVKNVPAAVN